MIKLFNIKNKTKGFTLIELIIYIGIVAVFLILSSNFAWDIIKSDTKTNCYREVQQNARFALERITHELRAGQDPSIFSVSNGVLYQQGIALTTDRVLVTDFDISSYVDTYKITLTVEYDSLGKSKEYEAMTSLESTVVLIEGATSTPSEDCWGLSGLCDTSCQHIDQGSLRNYYIDPYCNEKCAVAGLFYVRPTGSCSGDGAGSCYKMEDSSTQYLSCSQGDSCEGGCDGTCTPCSRLNRLECIQQDGCSPMGFWCTGTCTPCIDFNNEEDNCINQIGCDYKSTKWYWVLENLSLGYSSSTQCEWYE